MTECNFLNTFFNRFFWSKWSGSVFTYHVLFVDLVFGVGGRLGERIFHEILKTSSLKQIDLFSMYVCEKLMKMANILQNYWIESVKKLIILTYEENECEISKTSSSRAENRI